ncbi:MAG: type II CAAX endopeptidase family protein [Planctomycetota bacterium]
MLPETFSRQDAEIVLQCVGAAAIVTLVVYLSVRRRWRQAVRLPPPPVHRLEPIDLLLALMVGLLLPGMFVQAAGWISGVGLPAEVATQPALTTASRPAETMPNDPRSVVGLAAGQIAAGAVLLLIGRLRFPGGLAAWGLSVTRWPAHLLRAVVTYVAIWPVCAGLLYLTLKVLWLFDAEYAPPEHEAIRALRAVDTPTWVRSLTVIGTLVLAPIVEELLLRGLIQSALAKWWRSQWQAIIFSGCAFGLLHYSVGHTIPTLCFFGMVLGYVYAKTRSLTAVILLHAVFNGKTLLWLAWGV